MAAKQSSRKSATCMYDMWLDMAALRIMGKNADLSFLSSTSYTGSTLPHLRDDLSIRLCKIVPGREGIMTFEGYLDRLE